MTAPVVMHRRLFLAEAQGLAVELSEEAAAQIISACQRAGRIETGGILIGHYNARHDTAVIVEALSQPEDSHAGPSWFQRGIAGVEAALRARWSRTPRLYYLGEWHYHPKASADPSGADLQQMAAIAGDRGYRCPEPILMILGGDPQGNPPLSVTVIRRGGSRVRLLEQP